MSIEQNSIRQEQEADLEKARREFAEKNEFLAHGDTYGIQLNQIRDTTDFFSKVFDRTVNTGENVEPFEEKGSAEFQDWLRQKKAKVKKIDYTGYACWRYNPIIFYRGKNKQGKITNNHRVVLRDDWETMEWIEGRSFAIMSPVTYVGRNMNAKSARYLYAFTIDLDGVDLRHLEELFAQMTFKFEVNVKHGLPYENIPMPNIIVNSGHGLHLYYIMRDPIPLYEENIKILNQFKFCLTNVVWSGHTSMLTKRQYQGIFQGFRLPFTKTKFGEIITAWELEDVPLQTMENLYRWFGRPGDRVLTEEEINSISSRHVYDPTGVTREEAARRWPEWYARRIVEKKKIGKKWHIKRDLYEWWMQTLLTSRDDIKEHHRYWCILALVAYAVKCDIPRDEVYSDALALVPILDSVAAAPDNPFTAEDVEDAMRAYDECYCNWPKHIIRRTTQLFIPERRRNGRKQDFHLALARNTRDFVAKLNGKKWDENNGRKKATIESSKHADVVKEWCEQHPGNHNKSECARDTGLSRPTVIK